MFVEDTGVGIKPELVNMLMGDQYFTSRGTAGEVGSGLGLMICRDFLLASGSELHIKSEAGKGSTFSFTLALEKS